MKRNEEIKDLIKNKLTNEYISGFIQGDGSFSAPMVRNGNKYSTKLYLVPQFNISQHIDNRDVIEEIKKDLKI